MMMRVKMFLTLDVDPEDYPVPADENVAEEIGSVLATGAVGTIDHK